MVVVANGQALGLITRSALIDRFARPYRRELYGKRSCTMVMDPALLVDEAQSVQEVAQTIGSQRGTEISDTFVITREGRFRGVGFLRELMSIITDMQIRAARYANPLTQLPGNVPINEQIGSPGRGGTRLRRRLLRSRPFQALTTTPTATAAATR